MNIIAGLARNLELLVPRGMEIRPTAGRARKALFDSLGPLDGMCVIDLCSGSGAPALEAASRGAAAAVAVEKDPEHVKVIRANAERVLRTGVACDIVIVNADILDVARYASHLEKCGLILADPPYAESVRLFGELLKDPLFRERAAGSRLVWEIPDRPGAAGEFLQTPGLQDVELRRFGGTLFLFGSVGK
ncbi:MAG: RsmD family RNA methyltransferase [Lentisphaeria bacterium]|nr:RsmD family RNA methyltransferase [Lentisphaeria bacterium]